MKDSSKAGFIHDYENILIDKQLYGSSCIHITRQNLNLIKCVVMAIKATLYVIPILYGKPHLFNLRCLNL